MEDPRTSLAKAARDAGLSPEWLRPVGATRWRGVLGDILEAVVAILAEHSPFEFYVVGRHLDWMVGENHHGVVFSVRAG